MDTITAEKTKRPSRKRMRKTIRLLTCVVIVQSILLMICAALLLHFGLAQRSQTREPGPTYLSTLPTTEETVPQTTEPQTQPPETTEMTRPVTTAPTEPEQTQPETTEATEGTMEQTTPATSQPTQPTQPQVSYASELEQMLAQCGESYQSLASKSCTQLVTVSAKGITADIRFFTYENGQWQEWAGMRTSGCVGRNGVTSPDYKREGDGCTPTGLYPVGLGFYIPSMPNSGLDMFQVTQDTYWVDDPNSQYYNQRVEGTENKDWKSAEHMINYTRQYQYGFVVDYNRDPIVKGKGSAIFFHVSTTSTAGCIATSESMVLSYLARLDKTQRPHILIVQG